MPLGGIKPLLEGTLVLTACLFFLLLPVVTPERTLIKYNCQSREHALQTIQTAGLKIYRHLPSVCVLSVEGTPGAIHKLFASRRNLLSTNDTNAADGWSPRGTSREAGYNPQLPHVLHIEKDHPRHLSQAEEATDATQQGRGTKAANIGGGRSTDKQGTGTIPTPLPSPAETLPERIRSCDPPCRFQDAVLEGTKGEILPYGVQMVQAVMPDMNVFVPNNTKDNGVTICVIDSGVDGNHPDLVGNYMTGCENEENCPTPWQVDEVGHGTHVAGTIAARRNNLGVVGVIPAGAHLHFVRIFNHSSTTSSDVVAALCACRDELLFMQKSSKKQRMVVSMSFSGDAFSEVEQEFINEASAKGDMLFVAAAGNTGLNITAYPAGYENVMSVAAVHCTGRRAAFSCASPGMSLAAPGTAIRSIVPRVYKDREPVPRVHLPDHPHIYLSAQAFIKSPSASILGPLHDCGDGNSYSAWQACRTAPPGSVCMLMYRYDVYACGAVAALQRAGCSALLMWHNSTDSCELGTGVQHWLDGCYEGRKGKSLSILAAAVASKDGLALRKLLRQEGRVRVNMTVERLKGPYDYRPGTSMAVPHVSGVAARLWAGASGCGAGKIREALERGAKDLGEPGRDDVFGYGLVQARGAFQVLSKMSCYDEWMSRVAMDSQLRKMEVKHHANG